MTPGRAEAQAAKCTAPRTNGQSAEAPGRDPVRGCLGLTMHQATADAGDMQPRAQAFALAVGILVIVVVAAMIYLSGGFSITYIDAQFQP